MAGKLIQVDTFTVSSAVATVTLGGGSSGSSGLNASIDSDDVYMVTITNTSFPNDRVVLYRLTESGTANTSANYDRAGKLFYAGKAFGDNAGAAATTGYVDASRIESSGGMSAIIYIYNANSPTEYTLLSIQTIGQLQTSQTGGYTGNMGGGAFTKASAVDGIQFYLESSDSFSTGTFTLYKVV